jgi:hypothetical protein
LSPGAYLASKLGVLAALVVVQSALLVGVLALRIHMPAHGIVLPAPIELGITVVLAGFAGIALGLALSAFASTPDKAMSLIPIVLVPQVLFAGVMFALSGATAVAGWGVPARAAVDALSAIANLNELPAPIPLPFEPAQVHTTPALGIAWATLASQSVVFAAAAWAKLRR